MKILLTFVLFLFAAAGCRRADFTKSGSDVCALHNCPMGKRIVPIAYGMIPMSKAEGETGEWKQRMTYYPNPGDCLPATDINAFNKNRAVVYVCPRCEAAKKEWDAKKPAAEAALAAPKAER
jgi:hypothetical protein